MDFSSEQFKKFWPNGYQEVFGETNPDRDLLYSILDKRGNKNHRALEIGCGDGTWTSRFLIPRFGDVTAIDVIDSPRNLPFGKNVRYFKLPSNDYECSGIESGSIDFVWSYGVFCHLSNGAVSKYMKSVFRVLKSGGGGLIMFANWPKHFWYKTFDGIDRFRNDVDIGGWFYSDTETARLAVEGAGLEFMGDITEKCRDSLIEFKKT